MVYKNYKLVKGTLLLAPDLYKLLCVMGSGHDDQLDLYHSIGLCNRLYSIKKIDGKMFRLC